MQVIPLGHSDSLDAARVGHKAANLARFAATFRVPPAFCFTTSVYDELKAALTPEGMAERVALREAVAEAYPRLAAAARIEEPRVAVRSSATGEDGADASFAGQHETILNVRGVDAIVEAVLECWRSVSNERVIAYRKEQRIDAPFEIAVLVQQMVDADASAIAFGTDPVSGDRNVVVIDAAGGLGDKIASGEVTPVRYAVRKDDLVVVGPADGPLNIDQAREIAKLVLALERANEHPVDVECAFAGGQLYLLQCRPITTLAASFPVTWRKPGDEKLHWRRDDAHAGEVHPRLITDYTEYGPMHGAHYRAELFDLPLRARLEGINGRIYVAAERRVAGDVEAHAARALPRQRAFARDGRRMWDEEWLPELHAHYAWFERTTLEADTMPRDSLVPAWDSVWKRVNRVWEIHMLAVWCGFAVADELAEFNANVVGGAPADALKLTQGFARSLQQLERDLHRLSDLRATGDTEVFESALATFLASPHGNLGSSGEDMREPVWRDDPALLLAELDRRGVSRAEHPDVRQARLVAEGDAVAANVRAALGGRSDDLARFEELLRIAREVAPLTEEHNYHLDRQMQAILRRVLLAFGARMAADGQIGAAEDIYWFHVAEVRDALRDVTELRARAQDRATEFAAWRRLRHPRTLGGPPGPFHALSTRTDLNYRADQDTPGVLKGVAASVGRRRGRVRRVFGITEFDTFKPGDVLVCRSSNVSWIPLFTIAAAVVTDVGGSLSHAAVVAREFGVPAVVGCGVALETLRDGQLVEVDGERGTVRPLD